MDEDSPKRCPGCGASLLDPRSILRRCFRCGREGCDLCTYSESYVRANEDLPGCIGYRCGTHHITSQNLDETKGHDHA